VAVSIRTRFEVFKRDGFRCRYCGANAASVMLHVDHVVAIANGGSGDPANLITSCAKCNLGKSDVPLDESKLSTTPLPEDLREHAAQIRAYLAAAREVDDARGELVQAVIDRWMLHVDPMGMQRELINSLQYWVDAVGLESVFAAVDSTGRKGLRNITSQRKYFLACVRNHRDGT
jgi:hypothetical protein